MENKLNEFMPEFKSLGLIDDKGNLKLELEAIQALKRGNMTEMISMQNLNIDGVKIGRLDAKLNIGQNADGTKTLLVHPIYKKVQEHPYLDEKENRLFQTGGVHEKTVRASGIVKSFGEAPYQDNPENEKNYFIELEKEDGTKEKIWGEGLRQAVQEYELEKDEEVSVDIHPAGAQIMRVQGAAKRENIRYLFEFDKETKSMVAIDQKQILVPDKINDKDLNEEQKEQLKKGKKVELEDGATLQASPVSSKGFNTNKIGMIASVALDGGISYLIIKAADALSKKIKDQSKDKDPYHKKYIENVKRIERDLLEKVKKYPDDPNIKHDLAIVKKEVAMPSQNRSVNSFKEKVNDPDLEQNAERREQNKQEFKQDHAPTNNEEHDREHKIKR